MSEAARRLSIAQPALTYHIRQIEADYGEELFTRSRSGMELNEAGRLLLDHAIIILAQVERAESELDKFKNRNAGGPRVVRIAAIPSLATLLTSRLLAEMAVRLPGYGLYVIESNTRESRALLARGRVDLAITIADDTVPDHGYLAPEEMFFVMSANHHDCNTDPITFAEVLRESLILPSRGRPVRDLVEHYASILNLSVSVAYEIDGLNPRKHATISDLGRTLMPWISISDEISNGTLRARSITNPPITRVIALERRKEFDVPLGNSLQYSLQRILNDLIPAPSCVNAAASHY